jgi:hypothetical protein
MAMTQSGAIKLAGLSGVPELDNTAFRTARGLAGTASDLKVINFLGGLLWVGTGAPTHHGSAVGDQAYDTATGIWYRATDTAGTWKESYTS